jgi:DGQHR domain-containing protein
MTGPIIAPDIPSTRQFHFTSGRFSLSEVKIPYFQFSMQLDDAADSLHLVSEFPGIEETEWGLEELFQREVDWNRVHRQIVPYLLGQTKAHFFNAITVALLPITGNKLSTFSDPRLKAPELRSPAQFAFQKVVGPMRIGYYQAWDDPDHEATTVGQVVWNPRQTFAVAIDGQHRLAGIKELRSRIDATRLANTRIPVIAVMLAPEIGYTPIAADSAPVTVLRKLFIDLNKHAKPVHRSRQILLDDTDIHSLCVRAQIGLKVSHGTDDLLAAEPRLPLSLIDWHSETALFLKGPYITTVMGLDWAIGILLEARVTKDPTDYEGARKLLKGLTGSLGLSLMEAKERLETCEEANLPFYLLGEQKEDGSCDQELGQTLSAFRRVWSRPIVRILTEILPYKRLIALREQTETLNPEFVQWYMLFQKKEQTGANSRALVEYNSLVERLRSKSIPVSETELKRALKEMEEEKEANISFNVAFQRALFLAAQEFTKLEIEEIEEDEEDEEGQDDEADELHVPATDDETSVQQRQQAIAHSVDLFISSLNVIITNHPEILELTCEFGSDDPEYFWLGSLMKTGGLETIDFTLGGSKRASELIFWLAYIGAQEVKGCAYDDFEHFYTSVRDTTNGSRNEKRMGRSLTRFAKDTGTAGKILLARDGSYDSEAAWDLVRTRLEFIWGVLAL